MSTRSLVSKGHSAEPTCGIPVRRPSASPASPAASVTPGAAQSAGMPHWFRAAAPRPEPRAVGSEPVRSRPLGRRLVSGGGRGAAAALGGTGFGLLHRVLSPCGGSQPVQSHPLGAPLGAPHWFRAPAPRPSPRAAGLNQCGRGAGARSQCGPHAGRRARASVQRVDSRPSATRQPVTIRAWDTFTGRGGSRRPSGATGATRAPAQAMPGAGYSGHEIRSAVAAGRWTALHPGVYVPTADLASLDRAGATSPSLGEWPADRLAS